MDSNTGNGVCFARLMEIKRVPDCDGEDPRFPDNGKVEFVFGPSSDVLVSVSGFKSDVTVPVDDNEESLARSDSYENFNQAVDALTLSNRPNGNQSKPVRVVTSQPSVTSPTSPVAYSSPSRLQQYPYQHQPHHYQQPPPSQQQQQQQQQPQHQQPPHAYTPQTSGYRTSPQPPPYSSLSPRTGSGVPGGGTGGVEHQSAPDGSLYAVSRRAAASSPGSRPYSRSGLASPPPTLVSPSSSTPMYQQQQQQQQQYQQQYPPQQQQPYQQHQPQQQQPPLTNGSVNSNNITPGQTASYNTHYNSSSVATTSNTNINNNVHHQVNHQQQLQQLQQQQHHQQQQHQSRKTVQTLEEKTQLDELLNDLLSPTEVRPSATSPSATSPNSNSNMLGASNKTVTTTTRTYTSYNTTDSHRNPDRVLIQRAEVSYKVPGQGEVKDHYTIAADPRDVLDTSGVAQSRQGAPKGVPTGAFSYLTGVQSSTNVHTSQSSQRSDVIEHEVTRSPAYRTQQASPPPPARPTYRPAEFEIPPPSKYSDSYSSPRSPPSQPQQYSSLDSDANAWLVAQQQKLKNFKEGRDVSGRTVQEKNLSMMDQYGRQHHQQHLNGPVSPPQQFSSSYSSYVESSRSYGDRRPHGSNKPPPSPIMQRSMPPAQNAAPPAPIPARGSSREFMQRTRSNSSSSWQQQQQQQQQRSTLTRQQSDILYDRRDVEHIQPKSYGSTHSTPPLSPRAASPIGPTSTTTYTQYRTVHRDITDETRVAKKAAPPVQAAPPPPPQPQPPPPQQPPPTINHHYITEVFVHRTDLSDKTDSSSRLDELERNLEKASTLPQQKSSPPLQRKKAPSQQAPPAPKEPVMEEEIMPQKKANKVFQEAILRATHRALNTPHCLQYGGVLFTTSAFTLLPSRVTHSAAHAWL
ncbi:hypothetical protein RRG08_053349 [Elysia crispata]|uniref:Uncharacterized protein n=1 Tax=Elysia crispata TaxID=231223 RepID=A0AAE0ZKI7_9GAST|nr:hypothetical protein RRG08_053349 [Elysia crispata]